jgi:ABC-type oligopeptide transport system ATPase subunit
MDGSFILDVQNLEKRFNAEAGFFARFGSFVVAVHGVSFSVARGETYALVGESGCGKTTTARLLLGMYRADSGSIIYNDGASSHDVCAMSAGGLRNYREKAKYVFQDPARSLNPRLRVKDILLSGYRWSKKWPGKHAALDEAQQILEETGLSPGDLERRPQDFSGGQRQRIAIARALLMQPELLVCDEVVSALDVSIQGQILNLLLDLREKRSLSMLFITHDLKIACFFCDRVGVMYRGELMEEAPAKDLYKNALHPYTKLLFDSVHAREHSAERTTVSEGSPPAQADSGADFTKTRPAEVLSVKSELTGCVFAHRCPKADDRCKNEKPNIRQYETSHRAACFRSGE